MQLKYSSLPIIGFFSAMLCLTGLGLAQSTGSGSIRGTVIDPTGAAIPDTTISVLNLDTGFLTSYHTDVVGIYDTVSILPGRYRVTFSKEGFKTLVREGITVVVGPPVTVDATMEVGATQQTVEVVGQAPLMQTESPEQATNLQGHVMAELPNVTRTWTSYTNLLPGVAPGSQGYGGGTAGYSVATNGTMPNYASLLADGSNVALPHSTNTLAMVFESVSEVRIDTSTFSAQYGNGAAVFNQISKNGTNRWHGSLYEFVQNEALNARSFFSGSVPISKFNNYGGALGGPIRKDKAFFYFNFEKLENNGSFWTYYTFPTLAMRQGDFSDPAFPTIYDPQNVSNGLRTPFQDNQIPTDRMDPLALAVQKYFPIPNLPGYFNNLHVNLRTHSPNDWTLGRVDYNISSRHRLTGVFNRHGNHWISPSPSSPIDSFTDFDITYFPQFSWVWTISPTTVNEFRLGAIRDKTGPVDDDWHKNFPETLGWTYAKENKFPAVRIGGPVGATSLGANLNTALYAQTSYNPSDTVTMIRGRHILRFGGEVLYQQDNNTKWAVVNSGNFNFAGVYTRQEPFGTGGLGYADFLLGAVKEWSATNGPINAMRQISYQLFVQDDIKVKPNFTLNLGLRYQTQGGWYALHNTLGTLDPTLLNPATNTLGAMWFAPANGRNSVEAPVYDIILPRVGFSWNFKTKWVMRGGFGVYAIPWSQDTYSYLAEGTGSGFTGGLSDNANVSPLFAFSATNPTLNYGPVARTPECYNGLNTSYSGPYNTPVARNYQWSLSFQRELRGGVVAEAAYVGSHANDMPFSWARMNEVPEKLLGTSPDPQSLLPFPQYLNIDAFYFDSISNYNSLQLSLLKRFSAGTNFGINYTWSHMLSTMDSQGWGGTGLTTNFQVSAADRQVNYGNSSFDRRHMLKGYMIYQLPVGKGKRLLNQGGPLDWVAGGWQASAMGILNSGTPFTPVMGTQNLSGALYNKNWFPDLVGNPKLSNPTIQGWFNTAAYEEPAPFTLGNNGRNTLYGPRVATLDFSLAKSFAMPKLEDGRLQFRFDSTNVFNHPSFGNPNNNIGSPGVGTITSTVIGGRVIQLGVRLSF